MTIISPSGTTTFEQTKNQIIQKALMLIGAIGAEDTPSNWDYVFAGDMLDMLIKAWEAKGIGLWLLTEATLFLTSGQASYSIGGSTSANTGANSVVTTSTATAITGASTITLASVTGMNVSDTIGIVLDVGTTQWTTISAINTSTLVVTLNATLTSQASSGTNVYDYATVMSNPINITQVRFQYNGGIERECTRLMREQYFALPNKTVKGKPTQFFYDRQLNNGTLYFWPTPDSALDRVNYTFKAIIQDTGTGSTANMDFPQEWILPVTYGLATILAPAYGKDQKIQQSLGPLGQQQLKDAQGYDVDEGSIFMMPDNQDND